MPITWNPYLVALSILVAIFGSFTALIHAQRMRQCTGQLERVWMLVGGVTFGLVVWSMHFISMLAFHLPVPIAFDYHTTLFSALPAVAAAVLGFHLLRAPEMRLRQIATGGSVMGLGIAAMHYTGMAAMRMAPPITYDPLMLFTSVGIAVLASCGALIIVHAGQKFKVPFLLHHGLGGVAMGVAIAGMHYTAMTGAEIPPGSVYLVDTAHIEPAILALYVSAGVFLLLGGGIVASLFDQRIARRNAQALKQLQKDHAELEDKARAIGMNMTEELRLRQQALDSVSQGVLITDPQRRITYVNKAFEQITGYGEADILGRSCSILQGADTNPATVDELRAALDAGLSFHGDILNYRKDGTPFWNELSINPVHDSEGRLTQFVGVQRDITERKRAEITLKTDEEKFRSIIDASPVPMAVNDLEKNITFLNRAFIQTFGYTLEDIPTLDDWWPKAYPDPEYRQWVADSWQVSLEEAMQPGGVFTPIELDVRCKNGTIRTILASASPLGKQLWGAHLVVLYDVTERKLAESDLRIAATAFETQEGLIVTDSEENILRVNQAFTRMYGYSQEDVVHMTPATLQSGLHGDEFYQEMWEKLLTTKHWSGEIWDKRKNGEIFPAWLTISAVTDSNEKVTHYIGHFSDITRFKQTETELERHRNHLEELVQEQTIDLRNSEREAKRALAELVQQKFILDQHSIVSITDMVGRITYANDRFCEISGYTREELLGQDHSMLNSGYHPKGFFKGMYRAIAKGKLWHAEICNRAKDGHFYWVDSTIAPFMDEYGKPKEYISIRTDITKRKRAEQEADAANRAKSEFLANMSHEIRTPMNGVVGMVDVLQETALTHEQHRMVSTIRSSSLALLDILNDILDFSKIEAGKLVIETIPVHLRELAESVAELMIPTVATKGLDLHVFVSPNLPLWIMADPGRLRQILFNLLGNAVKFTANQADRHGQVMLRVESAMLADGRSGLQIRVIDNGIGMSPESMASLFQPFSQADASTTRYYGGTGLGLSITKRLVEIMHGQISVHSTLGVGSEFTVELPLDVVPPGGYPLAAEPDLEGIRVLAVTSNPVYAEILPVYLTAAGAEVTVVADAEAAHQQLRQSTGVAVLLLDPEAAQMQSALNGTDLASAVRVVRLIRRHSSNGDTQDVTVAVSPMLYHDLILSVAIAGGQSSVQESTTRYERRQHPRIKASAATSDQLILLAEDNETNRTVIEAQLHVLGYASEAAVDGLEALQLWRSGRFSLLLTDCHMPNMDGFKLTAAIREEEPEGKHFPIVAVTANALQGESERCLKSGMDGYLSKPMRLDELDAMLSRWLRPREPTPPTLAWDATTLPRLMGSDLATHRRLLDKFLVAAQELVAAVNDAVAAGDPALVADVAHKLKSSSNTVGAMRLGELCQALETAGQAGDMPMIHLLSKALSATFMDAAEQIRKG